MTAFTNIKAYDQQGDGPPAKTVTDVLHPSNAAEQEISDVSDGLETQDADSNLDEDGEVTCADEGTDDFYGESDDD